MYTKRKKKQYERHNIWRSYSDMMAGLLLLFVLVMSVSFMHAQKTYQEKLAEEAAHQLTQEQLQAELQEREALVSSQQTTLDEQNELLARQQRDLEEKISLLSSQQEDLEKQATLVASQQAELDKQNTLMMQQQSELDEQTKLVADQQAELDKQNTLMMQQQSELDEQTKLVADQQAELDKQNTLMMQQQSELDEQTKLVASQQSELDKQNTLMMQQQKELDEQAALVADQQAELDEQENLMAIQQEKIEQIIGVKADLIADLKQEFSTHNLNVSIDEADGSIALDANILFGYNENILTEEGNAILGDVLPVYCRVLMSADYLDYLAEIRIDGYTDTSGGYFYNLQLSQERALAVADCLLSLSEDFLTEEEAASLRSKLTANGHSMSNPVYDENGEINMDASRRVEIKFSLKDEEMIQELKEILDD